jgi:sugar-specific transcriptional regulator TrmB
MSDQTDIITQTLNTLDVSPDESRVYLHLLGSPEQSALNVSRQLHIARTKIYRLLDKLTARGLVTQSYETQGLRFSAAKSDRVGHLLLEKEASLASLRKSLPEVLKTLSEMQQSASPKSRVRYHSGQEGLKHVTYNSLAARGEICIYEIKDMGAFFDRETSERIRQELVTRKIHVRQLTNMSHIEQWTDVVANVKDYWTPRYVDPEELTINSEVLIYNDTYTTYHYLNNDIFCVEIENADMARMQKQIFEFVWAHATPMKKIGEHGEAISLAPNP